MQFVYILIAKKSLWRFQAKHNKVCLCSSQSSIAIWVSLLAWDRMQATKLIIVSINDCMSCTEPHQSDNYRNRWQGSGDKYNARLLMEGIFLWLCPGGSALHHPYGCYCESLCCSKYKSKCSLIWFWANNINVICINYQKPSHSNYKVKTTLHIQPLFCRQPVLPLEHCHLWA